MKTTIKNKKTIIAAVAATIAVLAVAAVMGCYLLLPSGYIALDINPSIEIKTNRLNKVTSLKGANPDAQKLLENYQLRDRDLDDVIEDLVDRMVLQGYLGKDNNANLLVTVEEGTVKPETLQKVNANIASYLKQRSVAANVSGQSVKINDDLRDRAAAQQISVGKLSVIDRLIAKDPTLRPEDLKNTRVGDLLAFAKERNVPLDLIEDRLDDLDDRFENTNGYTKDNTLDKLENQLDVADDINDRDDDFDDNDDDFDDNNDNDDDFDNNNNRDDDFDDNDDNDDDFDDNDDRDDDFDDNDDNDDNDDDFDDNDD